MRRIILALALAAVSLITGGRAAQATSCDAGHNTGSAWSSCSQLDAGYKQRVRGHYSTGIGTGGYVYGTWVSAGLLSVVNHSNMDGAITQLCAGGGC